MAMGSSGGIVRLSEGALLNDGLVRELIRRKLFLEWKCRRGDLCGFEVEELGELSGGEVYRSWFSVPYEVDSVGVLLGAGVLVM